MGLSRPETVPQNFVAILQSYTKQGFRVIAAAVKSLNSNLSWSEVDKIHRNDLEKDAVFLGLIIMQNLVKEETYAAIKDLHDADINSVMVTGDNILTAISVGRDCQLVKSDQTVIRVEAEINQCQQLNVSYTLEENEKSNLVHDSNFIKSVQDMNYVFACDGKTFAHIRNNDRALLDRIVQRGKIFARMLPEQKIHLIECMKDLGRQVIMCGDGCNDCGALKNSSCGVEQPWSLLLHPLNSALLAFCFTQLIAVLMVFYIGTEPSDNQYLVVDIGLAALPIVMIGNCGPHHSLVKQKPSRHLLSFLPLYEQTNIFLLSGAAAVIAAIVFSKGTPYRKPLITNGIMAAWTICAAVTVVFMSLYRTEDFARRLNMKIAPSPEYQYILVVIMVCNCIFCYMWENYLLDGILFFKVLPWYKERIRGPHLPFEKLEQELTSKSGWPPIGDCKNNEIKIAVSVEGSSSNEIGRSTSSHGHSNNNPSPASDVTPAEIIREVKRNIKNRWSSSSPGASPATEEDKTHLLASPKDSPPPYQTNYSVNLSSLGGTRDLRSKSGSSNITEFSSPLNESKMLSRTSNSTSTVTTKPESSSSSSMHRKETSC
ncbi:ATP13A3_4_5 [Lepeophtheirus salmonis]|uniref:ATP13A3_4_5 n=1 Tax=Lepeophtheirus salmonis TaxID=72036 RepID=A0A7R8GZA1_LEPSM|nr:ATP13A3_4_5 [Lepeophtheirus salmonis]CAF2760252.1 ATP13A3_4_5 [Lepeophtheirus salmonis]